MNELAYNIIEYIMITGTFLSIVLAIIACVFLVKESKKLTNSKVIVYTYRIGQRPSVFDIKKFKHTYITVEKRGVIIFVYSTSKKYKYSIFKTEPINVLLDKIEKENDD